MGVLILALALQNPWNEPPVRIQMPVDVYLHQLREVQKCDPSLPMRIWVNVEIGWVENNGPVDLIQVDVVRWRQMTHILVNNPERIGLAERLRRMVWRK